MIFTQNRMDFAECTHVGGRSGNEDYHAHVITDEGALFVVADGVGGHRGGQFAAQYFCKALIERVVRRPQDLAASPVPSLKTCLKQAAAEMQYQLDVRHPGLTPYTTCVAVWVMTNGVAVAHVGDSRLYLVDGERVLWHTRDHSVAQLLLEQGEITAEEARTHPDRSSLYRSIGGGKPAPPAVQLLDPLQRGQALVLCSDGFWEPVRDSELLALARSESLTDDLARLIEDIARREGGSSDNITAQVVRVV